MTYNGLFYQTAGLALCKMLLQNYTNISYLIEKSLPTCLL